VELDDTPSWSSDANDQQLIVQSSPTTASKPLAPSGQNRVYLQFGAFSARENAAALAQQLNRQISQVEYRDAQVQMHNDLYRVQIGPYQNRTEAINAAYRIQQKTGLSPSVAVR
ncbi:MAG: SPOR domain-containing protein, partial [Alcaligenes aquatilis]